MAMEKNKYTILIAGGNDKACAAIAGLLPRSEFQQPVQAGSAGEVRRMLLSRTVDLAILITPLKDETGSRLAIDLAERNLGVLLLVSGEAYEQIRYQVEEYGVVALQAPVSRQSLYSGVRMLAAMRGKLLEMERKYEALQNKMQDIRVVNRAKWLLMEQHKMSEQDAHYYIEKQAMDQRIPRRKIAEQILQAQEAPPS